MWHCVHAHLNAQDQQTAKTSAVIATLALNQVCLLGSTWLLLTSLIQRRTRQQKKKKRKKEKNQTFHMIVSLFENRHLYNRDFKLVDSGALLQSLIYISLRDLA